MWFYILIGGLLLFFLLYYHFSTNGPVMTGRATVVSRRMVVAKTAGRWSDNYNRLITFQLSDGSELELYVSQEAYEVLKDGESGQLSWQGDQLTCFDGDEGDFS